MADDIFDFEFQLELYIKAVERFEYFQYGIILDEATKSRGRALMNLISEFRNILETIYYEDLFELSEEDLIRYENTKVKYNDQIKRILETTQK